MKKIFLSLVVGGLTVCAFANEIKCDCPCQKDSKKEKKHEKCDMKKEKFNELSLEDIKKHISEKISFDEKRILEQKECLNKNTKEELKSCMEAGKPEKHHGCDMRGDKPGMPNDFDMKGEKHHGYDMMREGNSEKHYGIDKKDGKPEKDVLKMYQPNN